jgi:DNA (cytosine-5)-methyltransferase 1
VFILSDAIKHLREYGQYFDAIHASPPCQLDSDCQRIRSRDHPDLIAPTREALEEVGKPFVIENVSGAIPKLKNPVELCGSMFDLPKTYRHRYFETGGWTLPQPGHPRHTKFQAKMGRAPRPNEVIQAVGNFSGVEIVRQEWEVHWMNRDGIREAIPPAYTEWIGNQLRKVL